MNDRTEQGLGENQDWDGQINALLDGELGPEEAERLRAAADADPALARAIIEAYQLQQALEAIPAQRAPASLRRRLANIPREQRRKARPAWFRPAWISALAAVPLVLIALAVFEPKQAELTEPTAAEVNQARQELAVAFAYLGKVGRMTNQEIGETVNDEVQDTVNQNMIQAIQDQMEFNKERSA